MSAPFRVGLIIPAYNEAPRIHQVLGPALTSTLIDQVWVVTDGCEDETPEIAGRHRGVRVLTLWPNRGKGAALAAGVQATDADVLLFLDADLVGLTTDHIEALLLPVLDQKAMMTVGLFQRGRSATDWAQRLVPYISGQRALRRRVFTSLLSPERRRFGIETALTLHARRHQISVRWVPLPGATHVMKEEKRGWSEGARNRAAMYLQILVALLQESWRNDVARPARRRWARWKTSWVQE